MSTGPNTHYKRRDKRQSTDKATTYTHVYWEEETLKTGRRTEDKTYVS